jgi:flagellar protein FliS
MLNMNAVRAYQQAEQEFLVDGSDPHRLVQILFTELLASMDRTSHALELNDLAAKSAASSKALTIVYVLATSLDFERGGEVAQSLSAFYAWVRSQLLALTQDNSVERSRSIRNAIADIADAWDQIGQKAA